MNEENTKKLYNDFPLLYADHNKSMMETCMCWDFCFSDGWYKIVYELSEKLEKLIHKFLEENKDNLTCMYCMRKEKEHTKYYTYTEDGNTDIPVKEEDKDSIDPKHLFKCEKFVVSHPRCSQAKEKFAGLRFYMTSSTSEMEKLIDETEALSEKVCEDCGDVGEVCEDNRWYRTLCPQHVEEYNKPDQFGRIRNYVQCSKLKELSNDEEESE